MRTIVTLLLLGLCGCADTEVTQASRDRLPILITHFSTSPPNYAGGVDVNVDFYNTSPLTLRYVRFDIVGYNRVGDIAASEIGGKTVTTIEKVGPIDPGRSAAGGGGLIGPNKWASVWYNPSIVCASILAIELEYEGGYLARLEGDGVDRVLGKRSQVRRCS